METHEFQSSDAFMKWARLAVKLQRYDRAPVGTQIWTYADGHIAQTRWGKMGKTAGANLGFMISIANGKLDQQGDKRLIEDIDTRGGVVLAIDWGE